MRVEVSGLSKAFGGLLALRDVGFSLPSGRRTALVGPNGSGKSTLNRVVMGLLAFEGEVRIDGFSARDERLEIARRMAYVPQIAPALAVPAGELVRALVSVRGGDPARVAEICSRLGLQLDEIASKPFRSLSGGMKQKLLIALALAADASLLILDEPTGSLDARTREAFFPLFDELARDATVILCSHRLEEVRHLVDHVLLLDEGRLIYDGEAAPLLDASLSSVIEVRAQGESASSWLGEHGFRRGSGDWWVRAASTQEKLALLPELARALDGAIRDFSVRELDSLELAARSAARAENPDGR
ncbi:MAG: ABC transporter ATP-binding protein [Deltaproteobacteria bacterium]|nr:ABC transporter ATP-binding protein [Deltaproteobacteria bacterium]